MSAVVRCPNCGTPISAPSEVIGQVLACPSCQRPIQFVAMAQPFVGNATIVQPPHPPAAETAYQHLPESPLVYGPTTSPPPQIVIDNLPHVELRTTPPEQRLQRHDSLATVNVITWAVIALLVVGSGIVVGVAVLSGSSKNSRDARSATATKRQVPKKPADQASARRSNGKRAESSRRSAEHESYQPPSGLEAADRGFDATPKPVDPATSAGSPVRRTEQFSLDVAGTVMPDGVNSPPQAVENAHAHVTGAWSLPALITMEEQPLGSLSHDPTSPVQVILNSVTAAIPKEAAIFVERGEAQGTWTVRFVSDLQRPDTQVQLASLRLIGKQFMFAWTNRELHDVRRQVANCRLELIDDDEKATVQLRPVQQESPLVIDLEKDVQVREFAPFDLPKSEFLQLEIVSLDQFGSEPILSTKVLTLGKAATIEFKELAGTEIQVRFVKLRERTLGVRLEPQFREARSKTFEMSFSNLAKMELGVTRALRDDERTLPGARRDLDDAQSQLQAHNSTSPTLQQAAPWLGEQDRLKRRVKTAAAKVGRIERDIPIHLARLDAVPKIREFLTVLHQKATIQLRVVAECGDKDLLLVDATSGLQRFE